jgi:hypothetical protein
MRPPNSEPAAPAADRPEQEDVVPRGEAIRAEAGPSLSVPLPVAQPIADLRFRSLIGESAWASLPEAVRLRFGHRLGNRRTIVYAGEVIECRRSLAGRLLAQAARLIGSPLPLSGDCGVSACVSVTEAEGGGQHWTRLYCRRNGFPQVINSRKSFAGPTGLEEYLGAGFGIALDVMVAEGALHFFSNHYFWRGAGMRLRFPAWLAPGKMRVSHKDNGDGTFAFALLLEHRLLGELIYQTATFRERFDDDPMVVPDPAQRSSP